MSGRLFAAVYAGSIYIKFGNRRGISGIREICINVLKRKNHPRNKEEKLTEKEERLQEKKRYILEKEENVPGKKRTDSERGRIYYRKYIFWKGKDKIPKK